MNWADISFDWNHARSLLATIEEGSLSGAARVLGQTQPTLSRQISSLEDELGVTLFERVGRTLAPTPSARALADHVRIMRDAANALSLAASGQSQSISGAVKITASDVMSALILPPALLQLRQMAPLLEINVIADNSLRDLQRREADIAIRHVRPTQPDLISRFIRDETAGFYASTRYLDRAGRPDKMNDLAKHDLIHFGDADAMLGHLTPGGFPLETKNFLVGSENGVAAWEMAKAGLGIIIMADRVASIDPHMEQVLPSLDPFTFPIWLTTHRELNTSRRFRLVFDVLADFLK
jgi:DNA-binding transcriptional LysR family regulator